MFENKGFIKFKVDDYTVIINYLKKDDVLYGITLGDSHKVEVFNNKENILAGDGIKAEDFQPVKVEVISDKEGTKKLYDEMTELKHNHFKEYDDSLVTIKVTL